MIISRSIINDKAQLYKTVKHELRHARKNLENLNYADPKGLGAMVASKSALPYYYSCDNEANAATQSRLKTAIAKGDARIITDLARQIKENSVSNTESFAEYEPVRVVKGIPPSWFAEIRSNMDRALARKQKYQFVYPHEKQQCILYVDKYEILPNGFVMLYGYNVEDGATKAATLVADTIYRRDQTAVLYEGTNVDIDTEHEAKIRSLPTTLFRRYYRELDRFDKEEREKFHERIEKLPEEGKEVTAEEVRCRM